MKMILLFLVSFTTLASIDQIREEQDINAKFTSGKIDNRRYFNMSRQIHLKGSVEKIIEAITNYKFKCNPDYKSERVITSKDYDCKYPVPSIIETRVHKLKDQKLEKLYVLERRIYKRQAFTHIEIVSVEEVGGSVVLKQKLITEEQAKKYIENPIKANSVFQTSVATFKITPNDFGSFIDYDFTSSTDHWLLNKSMITGRVFDSMRESMMRVFESINKQIQVAVHSEGPQISHLNQVNE